jgi:hypothetical protein
MKDVGKTVRWHLDVQLAVATLEKPGRASGAVLSAAQADAGMCCARAKLCTSRARRGRLRAAGAETWTSMRSWRAQRFTCR